MIAYWDFIFQEIPIKASGELTFTADPNFCASTTLHNINEIDLLRNLMYSGMHDMQVISADGRKYCLYESHITSIEHRITESGIIAKMIIKFTMAILKNSNNSKYLQCSFTFDHINDLFPLECFDTIFPEENNKLVFQKEINNVPFSRIAEELSFKVETHLDGVYRSDTLFQLNITQTKRVYLCLDDEIDINPSIKQIYMIKQYFEFIAHRELHIKSIKFHGKNSFDNDQLMYSSLDRISTPGILEGKIDYRGTYDDIVAGLSGWIEKYNVLQTGIDLWLKQIYNVHISRSDIILWNCQVVESIGSCIESIKSEAQTIMDERIKKPGIEPNLFALLKAINNRYEYCKSIDDSYFSDSKKVRDKITHNNPKKTVTERQIKNTESLVKNWSRKLICSLIGLKGIHSFVALIPEGEEC